MNQREAIEEIRRSLDERGFGYLAHEVGGQLREGATPVAATSWEDGGAGYLVMPQSNGEFDLWIDHCTPERAVEVAVGAEITEDTSDGWHSFKDLYHHRALLFSVIVHDHRDMCWKSKKHHDGTELDWNFIVGINTPWGQASYHYGMEYWDMFDCKVLEKAPYYDGYTPEESVARIARLVELDNRGDRQ